MANDIRAIPPKTQSEEDFRTIVSNITGIQKDDPVFDRIEEADKRMIKAAKKAIDQSKVRKANGEVFKLSDLPGYNG